MSAVDSFIKHIKNGETINTSNYWCGKLDVNDIRDVARNAKKRVHFETEYKPVLRHGRIVNVAHYSLGGN